MRRFSLLFLLFLLWLAALSAPALGQEAAARTSLEAPALIRPGQTCTFSITAPFDCIGSILLEDAYGVSQQILAEVDLLAGANAVVWNGLYPSGQAPPPGVYVLRLQLLGSTMAEKTVQIGVSYPQVVLISQSGVTLQSNTDLSFSVLCNEGGTLALALHDASGQAMDIWEEAVAMGVSTLTWNGRIAGEPVAAGKYALLLTLENAGGERSQIEPIEVEVLPDLSTMSFSQITSALYQAYDVQASPPYSVLRDGSYWCMNPGEKDDAVIWDVLTQPITVYNDGRINSIGHVYLRENPDGSGRATAQIHGLSQGLHVIGEVNENGYVLVEALSNYDPDYQPMSDEEKATAFDICQGYILAEHLKTIEVNQEIGILIDKLTQRMYIFRDGKRVTELVISTGLITDEKYFYETIAGEFITIAHGSGYWSGDLYSDLPIRFNGGTMLHEVCCYVYDDVRYYGIFESRLGSKHSSGCVRVPYWENEEGYNMLWLYRNLRQGEAYKIIIWDDRNRNDAPTIWR